MFTLQTHRVFTLTVLVLSLATGTLQYFGNPINCWVPMEFTRAMVDYTDSFCYFNSTYFTTQHLDGAETQTPLVNYYKLTPFILAFFGVLYMGPEIIARLMCKIVLFDFSNLQVQARQSQNGSLESRKAAVEGLVVDLQHRVSVVTREKRTDFRRWIDRLMPSLPFYIQLQQLCIKLVFALGAILPLIFLGNYVHLNVQFHDQIIAKDSNFTNQTLFPKTILCDFVIRQLGFQYRYTMQCYLPANDMFEKVSLLICFLAIVVCSISVSDVTCCVASPFFTLWDYPYIKGHIEMVTDISSGYDEELFRDFVERYLKSDVIYRLQLIEQNSSKYVVSQILAHLWKGYVGVFISATKPTYSVQDEKPVFGTIF